MAKVGDFGAIPDSTFLRLVQLYGTFDGTTIHRPAPVVAVQGLTAMARAAHASATANQEPNIIELTMQCLELERHIKIVKDPVSTQQDVTNAVGDLVATFGLLAGLWRK